MVNHPPGENFLTHHVNLPDSGLICCGLWSFDFLSEKVLRHCKQGTPYFSFFWGATESLEGFTLKVNILLLLF